MAQQTKNAIRRAFIQLLNELRRLRPAVPHGGH